MKLSHIPDQIQDRSQFLKIIRSAPSQDNSHTATAHTDTVYRTYCIARVCLAHRDIASAIKDVLDAVNDVSKKHQGDPRMREYKKVSVLR